MPVTQALPRFSNGGVYKAVMGLFGSVQVKAFDVVNECYVQASVDFNSEVAAGNARVTLPGA